MKKTEIITALAASMLGTSAFAQINISENTDTRVFTAAGTMEGTGKTNLISLNIYNESGAKVYTGAIPTKDGSFSGFTFKLPDVTGDYTMKFTSFGASEEYVHPYVSTANITSILSAINAVDADPDSFDDEDAIVTVMNANSETLGFNTYWYGKLDANEKRTIAAAIIAGKDTGYTSLETVKEKAKESYVVAAFANRKEDDSLRFVTDFADVLDWATNVTLYDEIEDMKTSKKTLLGKIFAKDSATTYEGMYKAFDRSILLTEISKAKDPATIKKLIDDNTALITFDMATYNDSDEDKTCAYIYGKSVESMEALEDYIEQAYDNQNKPRPGGSSWRPSTPTEDKSTIINTTPNTSISTDAGFTDIADVSWAREAITTLAKKGVINGVSDTEFAPMNNVTREQFATMLVKAFNLSGSSNIEYNDMPQNHWAYKTVATASANGVVNGVGNGMFGTGRNITRQDMAVMAVKAAEKAGYNVSGNISAEFVDMDSVADYAKDSIVKMVQAGVMSGFEDETVRPLNYATRAQAAKIIYALTQLGK